jgi:hypothetical protein
VSAPSTSLIPTPTLTLTRAPSLPPTPAPIRYRLPHDSKQRRPHLVEPLEYLRINPFDVSKCQSNIETRARLSSRPERDTVSSMCACHRSSRSLRRH